MQAMSFEAEVPTWPHQLLIKLLNYRGKFALRRGEFMKNFFSYQLKPLETWKFIATRVNFPFSPAARKKRKFYALVKLLSPKGQTRVLRLLLHQQGKKIIDFSTAIHFLIRTWSAFSRWKLTEAGGAKANCEKHSKAQMEFSFSLLV